MPLHPFADLGVERFVEHSRSGLGPRLRRFPIRARGNESLDLAHEYRPGRVAFEDDVVRTVECYEPGVRDESSQASALLEGYGFVL